MYITHYSHITIRLISEFGLWMPQGTYMIYTLIPRTTSKNDGWSFGLSLPRTEMNLVPVANMQGKNSKVHDNTYTDIHMHHIHFFSQQPALHSVYRTSIYQKGQRHQLPCFVLGFVTSPSGLFERIAMTSHLFSDGNSPKDAMDPAQVLSAGVPKAAWR